MILIENVELRQLQPQLQFHLDDDEDDEDDDEDDEEGEDDDDDDEDDDEAHFDNLFQLLKFQQFQKKLSQLLTI